MHFSYGNAAQRISNLGLRGRLRMRFDLYGILSHRYCRVSQRTFIHLSFVEQYYPVQQKNTPIIGLISLIFHSTVFSFL